MKIHWFAITIFTEEENIFTLWRDYFQPQLGVMVDRGYGGKLYKESAVALLGAKLYYDPVMRNDKNEYHFHLEVPGQACDCLNPEFIKRFINALQHKAIRFNIKRMDFAFDDLGFDPDAFLDAISSDKLVSLAKRDSIRVDASPFKVQENTNVLGTKTVYLGSMSSQRMVRVYNKRGSVRLEFQVRDERAQLIGLDLFGNDLDDWERITKSHLRQYMDFTALDWWETFVEKAEKLNVVLGDAKELTFINMEAWLEKQVSVSMSVYVDVLGEAAYDRFNAMIKFARFRNRKRYRSILETVM